MDSVDLLSSGLLEQFKGLKKLEESLSQLLLRQSELLNSNFQQLDLYTADQEIPEVEHMVIGSLIQVWKHLDPCIVDEEDELLQAQAENHQIRHDVHRQAGGGAEEEITRNSNTQSGAESGKGAHDLL